MAKDTISTNKGNELTVEQIQWLIGSKDYSELSDEGKGFAARTQAVQDARTIVEPGWKGNDHPGGIVLSDDE